VYGFQIFEQSDILDPYHRSERKVKRNFSAKKTNAHDLYGFQRRQQRKARHEKLHPHGVSLVHIRVVGKLRTQHALEKQVRTHYEILRLKHQLGTGVAGNGQTNMPESVASAGREGILGI
jgi:hypothetical protein